MKEFGVKDWRATVGHPDVLHMVLTSYHLLEMMHANLLTLWLFFRTGGSTL